MFSEPLRGGRVGVCLFLAMAMLVLPGCGKVAVPDVVGMTLEAATSALTDVKLAVGAVTEAFSATVPAGQVVQQDPAAGTKVKSKSAVALVVSKGAEPVAVPSVVGMAQAAAATALAGAGLTVGAVTESFSAAVPAGQVISQNPVAGALVAPGSAVGLVVSKGPEPVTTVAVPSVVGMAQAAAATALTGAGLTVGSVTESFSATVPADQVISQTPAAGALVAPGSAVGLVVSKGPEPVTTVAVPNVVGMMQAAAATALTGAGLTVGTVAESFNATVPAGQVISQNPAAGVSVTLGASVALDVSKGPEPVPAPDIVGMTRAEAETAITGAGLTVGFVAEVFSGTVPAGRVISQNPPAGTPTQLGTGVGFVVSRGPAISVPDLAGMTQAEAEAALDEAGLLAGTVTPSVSETVPAGRVISQNPAAGTVLAANAPVDIEVSLGPALVAMPDVNLAAAVRTELGLAAGTPLTGAHLLALTTLSADDLSIADLTGLEHAANLGYLRLGNNQITSLAPLAGLTAISFLVIYQNQITDLSPLAGMTAMNTLNIRANQISDLTPLAGLVNMKEMMFVNNLITDLSPLAGLTGPATLYLSNNPLFTEVCDTQIPALEARGVTVSHDACIAPVAVPDLADMTQAGAESALTGAGLVLGAVAESFSGTVPVGQVISQNPSAGALVAPGSAVDVVISKGPSAFVPDVTWMLPATAESALIGAGLAVGAVTQANSDTVPAGQVVSQNPAAGTEVAAGSAVDFVVSLGSAPVNVPDAALAAAIRSTLGLAADTPLTGAHLLALTSLNGNNQGIADLTGLEHAPNLSNLYLASNAIMDLTPLSGLTNLINLGLYNNQVTDLAPLAGLTSLVELYLQLNQVADVTPLSGLSTLLVLDLVANQIVDVTPLSGLTGLTGLYLSDNQIVDVTPLSGLTGLIVLGLYTNQIVDVAPLSGLTGLVNLLLQDNKIADAAPLAALAKLSFLSLDWNQLTTVAPLVAGTVFTEAASPPSLMLTANPLFPDVCDTQIPALEARGVTVTHDACIATATVPDVAGLARSTAMTAIGDAGLMVGAVTESASETVPAGRVISQNPVAGTVLAANAPVDIEVSLGPALVTMPDANLAAAVRTALGLAAGTPLTGVHLLALTTLSADDLSIADLTGLEHAANLGYLRLGNNQITSLAPLSGLTAISFLVIYENQITDLSPLAGMTAMNTLNIHSNQIADLTPLAGLVDMKEMMFNYNQITDLSPLAGLTGPGAALYLSGNPLSTDACGTQIPALQAAGVTVTSDCL